MSEIALSASTKLTATGLAIGAELDFDEWENVGYVLGRVRDATAFALGDWLLWGEGMFGELAYQAVEATGRQPDTLREYVRVARNVPVSRRRPSLSFTHHQLVASRPPEEQDRWLDIAVERGLSVPSMRGHLHEPALLARRTESRPDAKIVELVFRVGRALCKAATPTGAGEATVPADLLDRFANALDTEWRSKR